MPIRFYTRVPFALSLFWWVFSFGFRWLGILGLFVIAVVKKDHTIFTGAALLLAANLIRR